DNDVPRRRCVFDILGVIESRQDLQSQDLGVKAPAALDVIALERAVGESLRQVAAFRQALVGERLIPMAGGVSAAVLRATGIVIFDLQMVAAGLAKIDRVSEVRALRFGDFAEVVFSLVGLDIFPGGFDFFMAGDAKAVMIVKDIFLRVRAALLNDHEPVGVWVLDGYFARS